MSAECPRCLGSRCVVKRDGGGYEPCPECAGGAVLADGFGISDVEIVVIVNALAVAATDPVWVGAMSRDPEGARAIWQARAQAFDMLIQAPTTPNDWMALANRLRDRLAGAAVVAGFEDIARDAAGGPK